jgi:hypothetical protein
MSSVLPNPREPITDQSGVIGTTWYRLLVQLEKLTKALDTTAAKAPDGYVLQRDAGATVFRAPKTQSYTVAMLPSAATLGAGTMLFATDARNSGEAAGAGTGSLVMSDGVNWKIPGIAGAVTA